MTNWHRMKVNPVEYLAKRGIVAPHIVFDPSVSPQYRIVRQSAHDGTMIFTQELIENTLTPLIAKASFYRPNPPTEAQEDAVIYRVGWLWISTVIGMVDLPCGRRHGERQRTRLPVVCEYMETPQ